MREVSPLQFRPEVTQTLKTKKSARCFSGGHRVSLAVGMIAKIGVYLLYHETLYTVHS